MQPGDWEVGSKKCPPVMLPWHVMPWRQGPGVIWRGWPPPAPGLSLRTRSTSIGNAFQGGHGASPLGLHATTLSCNTGRRCECPLLQHGPNCAIPIPEPKHLCKQFSHLDASCTAQNRTLCLNGCNKEGWCEGGFCLCKPGMKYQWTAAAVFAATSLPTESSGRTRTVRGGQQTRTCIRECGLPQTSFTMLRISAGRKCKHGWIGAVMRHAAGASPVSPRPALPRGARLLRR